MCSIGCSARCRTTGSRTSPGSTRARGIDPPTWGTSASGWRPARRSPRRPNVPALLSFDYAVLRVVPRVEREEFVNAGVVVFCPEQQFLEARVHVDEARLRALWTEIDIPLVRQ